MSVLCVSHPTINVTPDDDLKTLKSLQSLLINLVIAYLVSQSIIGECFCLQNLFLAFEDSLMREVANDVLIVELLQHLTMTWTWKMSTFVV